MTPVFETKHFIVEVPARPFIDRLEGGHLRLQSKINISDRTKLSPDQAREYIMLSMIVGEALKQGLLKTGVDIGIVNYQEMGNWSVFKPEGPILHMHIFGRAKTATIQRYGDAVLLPNRDSGFYDAFQPLSEQDIKEITSALQSLLDTEKYGFLKNTA